MNWEWMLNFLDVVIVSYNVKYYLEQCLQTVLRASEGLLVRVWVIDNGSTDGSIEYLKELFPEVYFIDGDRNLGFSVANNIVMSHLKGEYVLLLNPDTIVGEDVLRECMKFLYSHPKVGGVGVRMLHADGSFAPESRRGVPTPFTSFCKMSGLCALFPKSRLFGRYYMRYLDASSPCRIDIISGAFMMLRREALDQVGLLDERFFMYGEDVDLSYRLLQAGWENWYLPLNILHYKGESTKKNSFGYVHVFYKAMLLFFDKHYGKQYRLLGWLVRLAVLGRAALDSLQCLWLRFRYFIHFPPLPDPVGFLVRDLSKHCIDTVLEELRTQEGPRLELMTMSHSTGMAVCQAAVIPLSKICEDKDADEVKIIESLCSQTKE